jgi:hypothetical protein
MNIYTTNFRSLSFAIVLILAMSHAGLADVRLPKVIGGVGRRTRRTTTNGG